MGRLTIWFCGNAAARELRILQMNVLLAYLPIPKMRPRTLIRLCAIHIVVATMTIGRRFDKIIICSSFVFASEYNLFYCSFCVLNNSYIRFQSCDSWQDYARTKEKKNIWLAVVTNQSFNLVLCWSFVHYLCHILTLLTRSWQS